MRFLITVSNTIVGEKSRLDKPPRLLEPERMQAVAGLAGAALVALVLWDGFETIVLPRRVRRKVRLARLFYRFLWILWSAAARRLPQARARETALGLFGPLSLLLLLTFWAAVLVVGFALVMWGLGADLHPQRAPSGLGACLYLSGTSFTTLGIGDIAPRTPTGRALVVVESATGFGFLALVIGYLPVIYQAFSRREGNISMLDARAGSPPSAAELFHRFAAAGATDGLGPFLEEWERWAADVLETHISYPVLCYFRAQHSNESWLGALTTALDAASAVVAAGDGPRLWQAQLTFAMARHAVVDIAQILNTPPRAETDRLPHARFAAAWEAFHAAGLARGDPDDFERRLAALRRMYEPYVAALGAYLMIALPALDPPRPRRG